MILQSAVVPFNMKIKSLLKFDHNDIKIWLLFTALCWFNQRKQRDHLIHFTVRQNELVCMWPMAKAQQGERWAAAQLQTSASCLSHILCQELVFIPRQCLYCESIKQLPSPGVFIPVLWVWPIFFNTEEVSVFIYLKNSPLK